MPRRQAERCLLFSGMFPAVRDASEAFLTSAAGAMAVFLGALPRIAAAALILAAGWYLGGLLARLIGTLVPRAALEDWPLAAAGKWLVRLVALFIAFDALGLTAASQLLREMLLWLPHLAVGLAVLAAGAYLANGAAAFAGRATRDAGLRNPQVTATVARCAVWALAAIVALHQIGVGDELLRTLFAGAVVLVVLAGGLSLGLGGQEVAAALIQRWYRDSSAAFGRLADAGQQAADAVKERRGRREVDVAKLAKLWQRMGAESPTPLQAGRRRFEHGRIAADETFREVTVEMPERAEQPVIAKRPRVVEEIRVRVDVSGRQHTLHETLRDEQASIESFRSPGRERRKGNGSYTGAERRVKI